MKHTVLLINPPQTYYKGSQDFTLSIPIGVLSIAAVVQKTCNVVVYDCLLSPSKARKEQDTVTYGATEKEVLQTIQKYHPTIVGISTPFSSQRTNSGWIAKIVKSYSKKILVVVGGPDASVAGHDILRTNPDIDVCVQGEGEYVFLQIIKQYHHHTLQRPEKIPGIYYRVQGNIVYSHPNPPIMNLDELPIPKYDAVPLNKYLHHPLLYKNRSSIAKNSISVITSRGCPYNCLFCSVFLHMGRIYRTHSAAYVLRHIETLTKQYHITNIHFEDDNLTLNKIRFENILDGLIQNHSDIHWDTPNGIRADTLTFPLLQKMQRSGCVSAIIGIESGNQKVLDEIVGKHLDLKQTERVALWCKQLNLPLGAFFVIGFPGEKISNMATTLKYAVHLYERYNVTPNVFVANPLYGTKLYDIVMKQKYVKEPLTEKMLATGTQLHGKHLISTKDFSAQDITRLIGEYETKMQVITWGKYRNRYNVVLRVLKKIVQHYVYPSKSKFLWKLAYIISTINSVRSK